MNHVYILNDSEKYLIDQARKRILEHQQKLEQQEKCEHNWRYVCACHNDDAYECTNCGKSDYR